MEAGQNQNQQICNQAAANAPNVEPQPSVFKLDIDCWDEVLDCLSLEDVHSFGQTCKAFQRVTGEYFQWKYVDASALSYGHGIYINFRRMNGFNEFVQNIQFCQVTRNSAFHYTATKCKAEIKEFMLVDVDLNQMDIKIIEKRLEKVVSLQVMRCKFDEDIWRTLFESCTNLKRLRFWTNFDTSFAWPVRKHPTLEHLELCTISTIDSQKLKNFLDHCPNLRSLQISANVLWDNQDLICNTKVDDLAIDMNEDIDTTIGFLNNLHEKGFFKRLHFRSERNSTTSAEQILSLPGLVTLYIYPNENENPEFPVLPSIKEIGIINRFERHINTDAMVNSFINLEQLFIIGSRDLLPFIRRSIKLKDVEIADFEGEVLDIAALNKERKKLVGARKVTIYVNERIYLATKWATSDTSLEMIELKRQSSRDIIGPHSFWQIFR
ncbi:uncharacterized protein LOC129571765 [Sitodiplosis mosellana]|uniref:uncharacterized protein LOC129571761 n=1 Tax=Sitodiplosis mosellana TaxID=263140 RepID=UPI0024450716|nr:uncharacterized protein LOC129571761 [Sitodiplosis mosellana]XP_055307594.1 uncharacterized protein LOC129571761 [Sitodiplosis mosellana]XP_055307595.1 uncharacterized protein LOC129571763 [Sitodiplosis mosellana]XP_055307596.1 uncharacterized protein LOC129571764 [Sitodiplosis mosellana]XP_055307597.1 uncharacterized protein LOC129571764 [Sitodiplosis mosellana]XP_055307599.1 uncharacterized protein LOC129571765 [Sitodiplosis mosellana]